MASVEIFITIYTMQNLKILILLTFALSSSVSFAENSMRRCMLLPVKDSVEGSVAFRIFNEVENYLKNSEWCYYHHNSEILNILGNYKRTIHSALENEEVLKIIAEKTRSGSLIKIETEFLANGTEVSASVISGNGNELYFKETTRLDSTDPTIIAQTIKNWLEVYQKRIPYIARVVGVLGSQFSVDAGTSFGLNGGSKIKVIRPIRKKTHPLLKEVVDWETIKISDAKIFQANQDQSHAKVTAYESKLRIQADDWIIATESNSVVTQEHSNQFGLEIEDGHEFGKLGVMGIDLAIGTGSNTFATAGLPNKKIGGLLFGIGLSGELWITRHLWTSLNIERKFGSYAREEGNLQTDSNSLGFGGTRIALGYKYLPLGFFYGPQVDLYFGHASYDYGFDNQSADGIGEVNFSGLILGVRGNIPLVKLYRMFVGLEFMLAPGYEEDATILGQSESVSNYRIMVGGTYQYSPSMNFFAEYDYLGSKAKFVGPRRTLSIKDSSIKFGTLFNF